MGRVRTYGGGISGVAWAGAFALFGAAVLLGTFATVATLEGCATSGSSSDDGDSGATDDSGRRDALAASPDSTTPKDAGPDVFGNCENASVVINELMPQGTSGEEFIELYNDGDCAVSLAGWSIPYRSTSDNLGVVRYTFATGDTISAKSFLLLATQDFAGKKDIEISTGLGNTGGQIALMDDQQKIVDAVGWGTISGAKTFTEGSAAAVPGAGKSLARKSDGVDTDDNSADFAVASSPTPGVAN